MFTAKQQRVIAKAVRDLKIHHQDLKIAKLESKIDKRIGKKENIQKQFAIKIERISTHE